MFLPIGLSYLGGRGRPCSEYTCRLLWLYPGIASFAIWSLSPQESFLLAVRTNVTAGMSRRTCVFASTAVGPAVFRHT